jgi:hypothetical protein
MPQLVLAAERSQQIAFVDHADDVVRQDCLAAGAV